MNCLKIITREISNKYNIVPFEEDEKSIKMYSNHSNEEIKNYISNITNKEIIISKLENKEISKQRNKIYNEEIRFEIKEEIEKLNSDKNTENDKSIIIVKIVDLIISYSIMINVSDIHFEGIKDYIRVRVRQNGILKELCKIRSIYYQNIVSRIKVLSNLDYTIKNIPQDSRITYKFEDREIDIRVATIPTVFGEKVVLRILDRSNIKHSKEGIGLKGENLLKINKLLKQPGGLILVTGPTGSGKTSTLYTLLNSLADGEKNIITIEDPVEYKIQGMNQININEKAGLDFENSLESVLRLDPDIIMVGEIRNKKTAEIAISAAITGRLVLSTIHTGDSPSAIYRLKDMGIENYLISAGLIGIISQRLVRRLCNCKIKTEKYIDIYDEKLKIYEKNGCEKCKDGYNGRKAVFEVLLMTDKLRYAINNNETLKTLKKIAEEEGMISLKQAMKKELLDGETSLDEIYKNIVTI